MADTDTKATTKTKKATDAEGTKKRERKPVEPTAASSRPPRTLRKPNRFEFGAEERSTLSSKRKRDASKERSPAKKTRRSVSKSPSRGKKSSKKSSKREKDPDAPKKPLTAYMLFASANRDKIKKENPDATFGELGKLLGKAWKKASKSDRSKYEAKAEKEKEKYDKEMAKYKKNKKNQSEEEEESESD